MLLASAVFLHSLTGFSTAGNAFYLVPTTALALEIVVDLPADDEEGKGILYTAISHGNILREVQRGSPSVFEQALDDTPAVGGTQSAPQSGVSATSLDSPTASYFAPEQAFVLLSNLGEDESPTDAYRSVTIEAFTEGGGTTAQLFPIEFDGQKKWVSAITIKEAPTAVKGVINTFLPKKLKYFEYSENFAAWKPVAAVDEWGNFTIKDLNLGEGQNVIAFRAESWTGNKSNQYLKLILNSVPQFVGDPFPGPNTSTANVHQKIGVEANKACYTADPSEAIDVVSFQVDGVEKLSEADIIASQGTYTAETRAEWIPDEPLSEGQHDVLVKFQSNVGASQAIWSFNVDTIAPTVSIATLEPYSARDPTGKKLDIKFKTSDNLSTYLNNLSVRLYRGTQPDEDSNFVTEITQVATQAAGEQYVYWDGTDQNGEAVGDGIYSIKVKVFDQAGNWGSTTAQVQIDSTPPQIIEAHVSPNPMTKAASEFGFSGQISEKSNIVLKLTNLSENQTTGYITQSQGTEAAYTWRFDDQFMPNLKDGLYEIEVTAKDEAGNESEPYVISGIRIDRTPPAIYSQYADPFVLANSGPNPYQATLRYRLSEENDVADNKQAGNQDLNVKIKLYNENTGEELWNTSTLGSLNSENTLPWNASDLSIAKGSYKFQIVAYDNAGNYSAAYSVCVKDGVAPAISYPGNDAEISGTVAIRGTAMDPDWSNSLGFKEYRVYYAAGDYGPTISPASGTWKTDLVEVPEIYRDPTSSLKNRSLKPLQNDATLAYFYTDALANGTYTLLVVAEEEGGAKYASARTITVNNDGFAASADPSITLGEIPSAITFDGENELPISFTYGGKEINAYLEILKVTDTGSKETVFYKYFPQLSAAFYTGEPSYEVGNELGYFIWRDESGWHLRWNGEAGQEHRFNGSLIAAGSINDLNLIGEGITQISSIINWDRSSTGGEGGFDFKTDSSQLIISTWLDNDPASTEDDFDTLSIPFFGLANHQPDYSPVMITGLTGQTGSTGKTLNWDGKLETGAFVDSGNYIIRVRAEGTDGTGLTIVEKNLTVNTPFELANVNVSSTTFNPIGLPDRVTVFYNISKDALIKLQVYELGKTQGLPLAVIDGGLELGKTNPDFPHTISWRGNFPDNEGTQVVTAGNYVLKLVAVAADGTETLEKIISPNVKVETLDGSDYVKLDLIGDEIRFNGGTVRAAQGSSDYYWEARANGTYYPPINYSYTLGVQGSQKATVYPYVPFAGLLHRKFESVDVKFKVHMKIYGHDYKKNWWLQWEKRDRNFEIVLEGEKSFTQGCDPFKATYYAAADDNWEKGDFGLTKKGEITGAEILEIEVLSRRDPFFTLDKAKDLNIAAGSPYQVFGKGIFVVQNAAEQKGGDYNIVIRINLPEDAGIDYSRLTNRFIPWHGFVNKNHPENTDALNIPGMVGNVTKLGFPGRKFFEDPNVKISGKVEADDRYSEVLNNIANYETLEDLQNALDEVAEESYFENYTGKDDYDEVTSGYDAYLSKEKKLEFISVKNPDNGGFREEGLRWTAWADYVMSGDESPLTFNWPYDPQEYTSKETEWCDRRLAYLGNNPQDYSISNTAYEIDKAELEARMSEFNNLYPDMLTESGWLKRRNVAGNLRYDKSQNKYVSDKNFQLKE
ncbi:MAG: Ig-like domain repeat protein, partial [Candidatus Margulisbacteria bacterium]|nr:Ig-like domain repeat protein [Candidatus Margulisiibacteriota bacterium]